MRHLPFYVTVTIQELNLHKPFKKTAYPLVCDDHEAGVVVEFLLTESKRIDLRDGYLAALIPRNIEPLVKGGYTLQQLKHVVFYAVAVANENERAAPYIIKAERKGTRGSIIYA